MLEVVLTRPAVTRDTVVALQGANNAIFPVPPSVPVAFGASEATFTVQAGVLPDAFAKQTVPISASLNGVVTTPVLLLGGTNVPQLIPRFEALNPGIEVVV